jgi:hypothetical protein
VKTPPTTGDTGAFDASLPPSTPLLFYLFAEQVVPAAPSGIATPTARARLATAVLAHTLFKVAFWNLRECGLVRLELRGDVVRVSRVSSAADHRLDGIEGGVLQVLSGDPIGNMTAAHESVSPFVQRIVRRSEELRANMQANMHRLPAALREMAVPSSIAPDTVSEIVAAWYGSSDLRPERVPIRWMEREGVEKGLLTEAKRQGNPIMNFFRGGTVLVPQRDRIAAVAPRFDALLRGWRKFQTTEAPLFQRLEHDIAEGIEMRRDSGTTS